MKKELKIIAAFGAMLFSTWSFASSGFVTVPMKGIFQNTTNHDLVVHYSTCIIQPTLERKCTPPLSLHLAPKSSNYENPVVVNLENANEMGSINILSVSDPKNHIDQNFNSSCALALYQNNIQPSVLTLSSLIDNSNIIVCTPGTTRK